MLLKIFKNIKPFIIIIILLLLIIISHCFYHYYKNRYNFPFRIYNFPELTINEFNNITTLSEPALFINTLKYDINFEDFCRILSNKEIRTREGNYGTTDGRKDRIFKKEKIKDLCKNLDRKMGYGGNNIISLKELSKINFIPNTKEINIFLRKDKKNGKLWIGPSNSRTPLHKDKPDNLALQIYGKKTWKFFNRKDNNKLCFYKNNSKLEWSNYEIGNFETCESARDVKMYMKTLNSGDMLYLPKQWPHDVKNETKSIMINFWYN